MRHERNFEIDHSHVNKAYVVPYPDWIVTLVWLSVFLFGGVFWWSMITLLAR